MVPERRERYLNFYDFSKAELSFVDSRYDPAKMLERREEQSADDFKLGGFFNNLPAKERTLVSLRYGIGYTRPYSVAQCAMLMQMSLENIRRMESHAMITMQDRAKQMFDHETKQRD